MHAQSANTARVDFIQFPSQVTLLAGHYFFLPEAKVGCHPAVFWLGAAAIVFIFPFLGFFDSRLPFAMPGLLQV
jgi:hypothetical protein